MGKTANLNWWANAGFLNHQTVGWVSSSSEFQSLCCCSTAAPLMTCLENSHPTTPGAFRKSSRASWESLPIWPCHTSKVYLKVLHGNPWHGFLLKSPRNLWRTNPQQFPEKNVQEEEVWSHIVWIWIKHIKLRSSNGYGMFVRFCLSHIFST